MAVDVDRFQAWLGRRPGFEGARVTGLYHYPGGASNITCRVDLEGWVASAVVLRLQREDGIFAPYDIVREGRVMAALADAPFPVPSVVAIEPDAAPLGAPFLLIEHVDGLHMGEAGPEADYGAFVQAVTAIHALDWRRHGLEFLGVPKDARSAVLGEVEAVARRMERFGCSGDPLLGSALDVLRRVAPSDGWLEFCQGDINVFNYLFRGGRLVGVVDWEQARIGDRRSDVGQLVALSHLKGAPFGPAGEAGFVRAYEAAAGRRVPGVEYFRAFWLFQLGVIHAGWVAFNGTVPWYSREDVDRLLVRCLREIA